MMRWSKMFSTTWSQIGSTWCWPSSSWCYPLLNSTIIHCYLTWRNSINLSLIIYIRPFHINFIKFSISTSHHVIIMYSRKMFCTTSKTFSWKYFLLRSNNINTFFRFIYLTLNHFKKTWISYINTYLHYNSILILFIII